jgi:hypothetical protein
VVMRRGLGRARRKVGGAEALYSVPVDGVTVHRLMRIMKETGEEYEHILRRAVALWDLVSHSNAPLKGYPVLEREARNRRHAEASSVGSVARSILAKVREKEGE